MKTKKVVVQLAQGMHARPAAVFVGQASQFQSEVLLSSGGTTVNGKSIMGILMLALSPGSEVELQVDGADEEQAIQVLAKVLLGNAE